MNEQEKLYIGTSGWSYPKGKGTWNGYFYPPFKVDELRYYSQFFNTVEVNSSFYRPPDPGYVHNWAGKVPAGFLFTIKLWQKFTHSRMYKETTGREAIVSQKDVDLFKRSIEPLATHGKLGALLAQFPSSFRNDTYNLHLLGGIINIFGQYKLAVEMRHNSWSDDPNIAVLLKNNNISWVHIDEPQFNNSISRELPVTSDLAYFRLHGRNTEMWWIGDSETRYNYLYSPGEILELSLKVNTISEQVRHAFVFFNNHWRGYAPRNAVDMLRALKIPARELPLPYNASINEPF